MTSTAGSVKSTAGSVISTADNMLSQYQLLISHCELINLCDIKNITDVETIYIQSWVVLTDILELLDCIRVVVQHILNIWELYQGCIGQKRIFIQVKDPEFKYSVKIKLQPAKDCNETWNILFLPFWEVDRGRVQKIQEAFVYRGSPGTSDQYSSHPWLETI